MQPNDQQGFNQPGQNQPVPAGPAPQPLTPGVAPVADPGAAMQAALNEPLPQPQQPLDPAQQPVDPDQIGTDQTVDLNETPTDGQEFDEDSSELPEDVTWVAQEFIHREKGAGWFILFTIIIIALIGISIWTQAWTFTALIVVIAVLIIVYSRRPPRELTYSITDEGLTIDSRLYKFSNFKSFGVIHDGEEYSIMLIPTQRFQPGTSVYFPEESGEAIVDMLGSRLPMKDLKLDAVDRVVRLLRL